MPSNTSVTTLQKTHQGFQTAKRATCIRQRSVPAMKPPPCTKTRTGSLASLPRSAPAGAKTLRYRQSSARPGGGGRRCGAAPPQGSLGCEHAAATSPASKNGAASSASASPPCTCGSVTRSSGGRKRRAPAEGESRRERVGSVRGAWFGRRCSRVVCIFAHMTGFWFQTHATCDWSGCQNHPTLRSHTPQWVPGSLCQGLESRLAHAARSSGRHAPAGRQAPRAYLSALRRKGCRDTPLQRARGC